MPVLTIALGRPHHVAERGYAHYAASLLGIGANFRIPATARKVGTVDSKPHIRKKLSQVYIGVLPAMLRSYRHFILVLVGCLSLANAPYHGAQSANDQSANAVGEADTTTAVPEGHADENLASSDYIKKCEDSEDRFSSELCAQWSAAKAAEKAAKMAEWQFLASVAGVGGLIATLALTLTATRAATRQAKVAERTLTEIERPYLFIESVEAPDPIDHSWYQNDPEKFRSFEAHYEIKNHGRTPAIVTAICGQIYIGNALPEVPAYHGPDIHEWERVIAAGESEKFGAFYRATVTPQLVNDLFCSRIYNEGVMPTRCYFFGFVRYESVHGLKDEVGFIWEFLVKNDQFYQKDIPNYTYRRRGGGG